MGQDLIWIVRFRSGGSGLGQRGAALRRRRPKSRGGAARKPRRTSAFWGFQGLVWAGVWPWSTTTACVTHWRQQGGGSGRGTACAAAKAALRGGAHRRARVCMNQSIIQGATGTVGREGAYRGSNLSWGVVRGVGVELRRWRRAAFVEGSGGGRLEASGPGGSTQRDPAVLEDGAARPERHRQRRVAAVGSCVVEQGRVER